MTTSSRFVLLLAVLAGCGARNSEPAGATRIVSLVPSVTECIFAVGAEALLVGVTNQCDFPERVRVLPRVGDFAAPDMERIAVLKPTLVFVTLPLHRRVAEKLDELRIRWRRSDPTDLPAVIAEIETIAVLVDREGDGRQLAAQLRQRLDSLTPSSDTPKVYVEISSAPLMSVGGGTFISDVVSRAGGRNVLSDVAQEYPVVEPELIAMRNPDVILILHPGTAASEVRQRSGWGGVNAVLSGRVFDDFDEDLLLRPGPRAIDGAVMLFDRLHPRR